MWYTAQTGNDQGLVIDEETGKNIAVTYDEKDAPLVASAPELLAALERVQETLNSLATLPDDGKGGDLIHACDIVKQMNYVSAAIEMARGES